MKRRIKICVCLIVISAPFGYKFALVSAAVTENNSFDLGAEISDLVAYSGDAPNDSAVFSSPFIFSGFTLALVAGFLVLIARIFVVGFTVPSRLAFCRAHTRAPPA